MAATATILKLVSVDYLTNTLVDWSDFFCGLLWGNWRTVPFNDQRRCSFKMAAVAAILDLISVDYLTNAWVVWSYF
jgi:hypothetical protein